jgi:hypothetical protein
MFRQIALASVVIALAAAVTGCGSSGSSGGSSPLAPDTVAAIIQQATANTLASQSFTISGGASATLSIDMTIVRSVGCTGIITQGATKEKLIWVGKTVYGQKTGMAANQWQRGASDEANLQGLISVCEPSTFLDPLLSATGDTNATRSVTTYNGQPALSLSLPASSQSSGKAATIVVTNTDTPLLLSITEPGAGNFTFTGYGAVKTIEPPSAS